MIAVWIAILIACIVGTAGASQRAVTAALGIVSSSRLSPALVGLTVMSVGTDLPEIANSIVSTASGHGDVNVGDSMGSVLTQVTLVLGILCLFSTSITAEKNFVVAVGSAAFFASVVVWAFVGDGELSRFEGAVLIIMWFGGTVLFGHSEVRPREVITAGSKDVWKATARALFWLGLVGVLSIGVVRSFLELVEVFGIPEFVGSFVALSLGTSLPELAVDWTALRKGAGSMAVGDIFGSSFVDATLSIAAGPVIFSSAVSSDVRTGVALAAIAVALATILTVRSRRFDRRLGVALIVLYGTVQTLVALL